MISEKIFISTLKELKNKRKDWEDLVSAMCKLCPGNYVDFWPELEYETLIENVLNDAFEFEPSWSPISYFMIDGGYGEDSRSVLKEYEVDGFKGSICTFEKLYKYCVDLKTYLKEKEINEKKR